MLKGPAASSAPWASSVASHSATDPLLSYRPPDDQLLLKLSYFELLVSVF